MGNILRGHNLAVIETSESKTFQRSLVEFAHTLDFKTITAMLVIDQPFAPSNFYVVDNTPAEYLDAYYEPSFIGVDPVMQHCKRLPQPIVWDQSTYVAKQVGVLWEQQAKFGYRCGVALALHSVGGRHFFLGVDRDQAFSWKADTQRDVIASLNVFASFAQEKALQIFTPDIDALKPIEPLTPTEIELLRWSMDGISVCDISKIMSIAECDASSLLINAMVKLRCNTKYQAIIKAIRFGLIH